MWKLFVLFCVTVSLQALEPVIVVLGPPGAGKGLVSQFFKEECRYNHLSAGDILRHEIEQKTPIGLQIEEIVKRGERVDATLMQSLLAERVSQLQREKKPFLIDGFGGGDRDIAFLHSLLSDLGLLEKTFVLFLEAEDAICKNRMLDRMICSECNHVYNLETQPPQVEGQCDLCLSQLMQRTGDTPQVIENRLILYRSQVEPNYKKAFAFFPSLLHRTDGGLEECMRFYHALGLQLAAFEGNATDFVRCLCAKKKEIKNEQ